MSMEIDIQTAIFTVLNFILLCAILSYFLFKPLKRVITERRTEISGKLIEAEQNKSIAEQLRKEIENNLKTSKKEGKALVEEYKKKAEKLSDEVIKTAHQEAQQIMDRAAKETQREKEKARAEIREEVVGLAVVLSAKALERSIDEAEHRRLIDEFIAKVGN